MKFSVDSLLMRELNQWGLPKRWRLTRYLWFFIKPMYAVVGYASIFLAMQASLIGLPIAMLDQLGVSRSSSLYWYVAGSQLAVGAALSGLSGARLWQGLRAKIISVEILIFFLGFVFGVWFDAKILHYMVDLR